MAGKKPMIRLYLLLAFILTAFAVTARAAPPDWRQYEALLETHLTSRTEQGISLSWLDYSALAASGQFDQVVNQVESYPLDQLQTHNDKLAFYINAYNIYAIKTVLAHWPLSSIKDAGAWYFPVWKKTAGSLGGKTVSLDNIENDLIRPMGDPRIHFAIVCASLSCPDLRPQAYVASDVDKQLEEQTAMFLANGSKGSRVENGQLSLSKIFDWFAEDFSHSGGVQAFVSRYRPQLSGLPIGGYISYNWDVNGE